MRLFILVSFVLLGLSCSKNICCDIPEDDFSLKSIEFRDLQRSLHQFGSDIFKNLSKEEETGKNIIISPLSIQIALYMTYNGASGDTRKDMAKALGWDEIDPQSLNQVYSDLIDKLQPKNDSVQLQIANAVFWDKNSLTPYDDFKTAMEENYQAEMLQEDFQQNTQKTLDKINNWVDQKTNGKIDKILEELDPNEIMFLVNALYFIASWDLPFDENQTRTDLFNTSNGQTKDVEYMTQDYNLIAYLGEEYQAIESQFTDPDYAMYFLLPAANRTIDQFVSDFNFNKFYDELEDQFMTQRVELWLPKFEIDYKIKLNEALKTMGMEIAFDKGRADFSKIGEVSNGSPYISRVEHKTYLKIDEKGAEGAAVTAVGISVTSLPPRLKFDRPFMIILLHKEQKIPIFIGKIEDPK